MIVEVPTTNIECTKSLKRDITKYEENKIV